MHFVPRYTMMRRLGIIWWLIALSVMATIAYGVHPTLIRYGMHGWYLASSQWDQIGIQFLLYQFLHGGALHLFSNAFFLVFIGIGVQYAMSVKRFFFMFLFTTLFVGVILLFTAWASTIGMSWFAMAVLSYYTMMLWSVKNEQYKSGLVLIAINIFIGLDPAISLGGHLWWAVAWVIYWYFDKYILKYWHTHFSTSWQ